MKTKLTGIYLIKNKLNGHCYIGQSVDIKARWNSHKKCSSNQYLMNAIIKYGEINFGFFVIKVCARKNLSKWERYYLERITCDCSKCFNMKPHYNLEISVNDSYTISDETKQKMSEIKKGENNPFYGKKHSLETIKKISEAQKGKNSHNYGKKLSPETKKKMSKALKGRKHSTETLKKMSKAQTKEKNGNWKGGVSLDKKRYFRNYRRLWRMRNKEKR